MPSPALYGFSEQKHGNMAFGSNELPEKTLRRRHEFLQTLFHFEPPPLFTVRQVHGNNVVVYEAGEKGSAPPTGDAVITRNKNVVVGVLTADCIPIILFDRFSTSVGIIHAGRMGTLKGVTGKTVKKMVDSFKIDPGDLFAVIGPGILKCCYQVGVEALEPFEEEYNLKEIATMSGDGTWKLDLVSINSMQILSSGIPLANICCFGICTRCTEGFFSYRRGNQVERFLSVVSLFEKSDTG
ncbi:MAG: peptidoglycan editing factor PgeF [Nitrospinota bacterium]